MDQKVKNKFDMYPADVQKILKNIRRAIFEAAKEDGIEHVEETLKWGEPSYIVKSGSTVRFDWKPKRPNHYAIYFNCRTTLVETFKTVYGETFSYDGNRAIVFKINDIVPFEELKHCISLSFNYHKLKHLHMLGI